MNILQTLDFLKLKDLYEQVWDDYLQPDFSDIVNRCTLNLSGLNPRFLSETNTRVPLREILAVRDRIDPADKFLSLLFRHRLDALL
jgi:hypothetical protein